MARCKLVCLWAGSFILLWPDAAETLRAGLSRVSSAVVFPISGIVFLFLLFRFRAGRAAFAAWLVLLLWLPPLLFSPAKTARSYTADELTCLAERLSAQLSEDISVAVPNLSTLTEQCRAMTGIRVKTARFAEALRFLHIAGIYIPLTGEAIVSPLEPAFALPYIALHETAHAQGIMDEGMAGVYAYRMCRTSPLPMFRYSGSAEALYYVLNALNRLEPECALRIFHALPERAKTDLLLLGVWNEVPENALRFVGDYAYLVTALLDGEV